ncbi:MAG: prepilin-type N-terminal cleavage/methylation domain-containing protein [Fimbriimonadaceae bacterium]
MRKAFTLIEVIVVVTIIAVLAAIIFPVFARAKASAKQASCISNLRQIAVALSSYMVDSDGVFPHAVDPIDKTRPEIWDRYPEFRARIPYMPDLDEVLQPYVKNREVFHCPADIGTEVMDDQPDIVFQTTPSMHKVFNTSYFFRTEIAFRAYTDSRFQLPAETNVLMDAAGHWHGGAPRVEQNEFGQRYFDKLRRFRYNTLFGDLHVKNLSNDQLQQAWSVDLE